MYMQTYKKYAIHHYLLIITPLTPYTFRDRVWMKILVGFIFRELGAFHYDDLVIYIVSVCLCFAVP